MAIVIAIHYFWGKTPPLPKQSKFFAKHKKTIYRICDIFLISVVLFGWVPIIYMSLSITFEPIFNPPRHPIPLAEHFKFSSSFFFIASIPISGISGGLIGLLSIFHSNITKVKRIILLIVSLFPLISTTLLLLIIPMIMPTEESEQFRISIIILGLGSLLGCWIINGPAIIIGKHFLPVTWTIMRALRLVSGDYPG